MRYIELDELKKIEYECLCYVADICKKHQLRYYLCGGTLLGAVRHNGFIPWDDDIDILMPRKDMEKLREIMRDDPAYFFLSDETPGYGYAFAKVTDKRTWLKERDTSFLAEMGVYIDVFPLDGMPEDDVTRNAHIDKIKYMKRLLFLCSVNGPKIRKNVHSWWEDFKIWWPNRKRQLPDIHKEYLEMVKQFDYDESNIVMGTGGVYGRKGIYEKAIFASSVLLNFERGQFNAPVGYDAYLTRVYGDYMQLPPENKQKSHHFFKAGYRD